MKGTSGRGYSTAGMGHRNWDDLVDGQLDALIGLDENGAARTGRRGAAAPRTRAGMMAHHDDAELGALEALEPAHAGRGAAARRLRRRLCFSDPPFMTEAVAREAVTHVRAGG